MSHLKRHRFIYLFATFLVAFFLWGCVTTPQPSDTTPNGTDIIVSFETDGGTLVEDVFVEEGMVLSRPVDPDKVGFSFVGWYTDVERTILYDFSEIPTTNFTLYALWEEAIFEIIYHELIDEMSLQVSAGKNHTLALTLAGRVFSWGDNSYGQLGDGTEINRSTKVEITDQFPLNETEIIVQVIAGANHSLALSSQGKVFAWGRNQYGQLGNNSDSSSKTPVNITSRFHFALGEKAQELAAGGDQSFVISTNGRLFGWGANYVHQLGNGTTVSLHEPTLLTSNFNLLSGEEFIQIAAGGNHALALTNFGKLFSWGDNQYGQLGNGETLEQTHPVDITSTITFQPEESILWLASGQFHNVLATSAGRIFAWGRNTNGQLGDGTLTHRLVPTELTEDFALGTEEEIVALSACGDHSFLVTNQNRVFSWGANQDGQLGDGTKVEKPTPSDIMDQIDLKERETITQTTLGYAFSFVQTSEGRLFAFGANEYGQLGNGVDSVWALPVDATEGFILAEGDKITRVFGKGDFSLFVSDFGRIFASGENAEGQLGDGTKITKATPVEITSFFGFVSGETITDMAVGKNYSLLLSSTGRIFSWGGNAYGQLGDGTKVERVTPVEISDHFPLGAGETIVSLYAGGFHAMALTSENRLFSWGNNSLYQVGDNTVTNRSMPVHITNKLDLNISETIVDIALGGFHSLVLTSTGRVLSWGLNASGQLGDGTMNDRPAPTDITALLGLALNEKGQKIAAGENHSLLVTDAGRVVSWGENRYGQLGDGTTASTAFPIDITSGFVLDSGEEIVNVFCGNEFSMALSSFGKLFSFGNNFNGQLGDGTTLYKLLPTNITSNFGLSVAENILAVNAGWQHSLGITSEGTVFAFGSNSSGQLGIGDTWSPSVILDGSPRVLGRQEVIPGTVITILTPEKPGFTFGGWYTDQYLTEAFGLTIMPDADVILYAKWIPEE